MLLDACLPIVLLVIAGAGFMMGMAFAFASLMMGWIDFRIFNKPVRKVKAS